MVNTGVGPALLRFFAMLAELVFALGVPYGVVWVGGWFLAGSWLLVRSGKTIRGVAGATLALAFVGLASYYVDELPTDLVVQRFGFFVLMQFACAIALAGLLLWARWLMLQRRTPDHVLLYAPVYLFPVFVLGVVPYWWLISLVGQRGGNFVLYSL